MKRIYTKTGDKGMTGIHGGERVPKDDIRIEANGCLDELNAVIGIVRSMLSAEDEWQQLLHAIQRELMVVMSHVATPSDKVNPNHRQSPLDEAILCFVNRLSDLFFVMARMEMQRQNWPEEKWQEFAYKRKKTSGKQTD